MRCSIACSAQKWCTWRRVTNARRRCSRWRSGCAPRVAARSRFRSGHRRRSGALSFTLAVAELIDQMPAPDVIVHSTSSGGTQAGLVAGCRLLRLPTRVLGVSADESRQRRSRTKCARSSAALPTCCDSIRPSWRTARRLRWTIALSASGYGVETDASREAIELAARTEAIFLDPTYTAKAMAALIAYVRQQKFVEDQTVLFWHTGGQVGLFR